MPITEPDRSLDDVQVMGSWNFTLQGDTPLYWLRSGTLDRYHMRFCAHTPSPSTCGFVFHAEADGPGTDGVSFWVERRKGRGGKEDSKRYLLAGEGLDSKAIVTRTFPDDGAELAEHVEVLVQGHTGVIFLQDRKVQLRFRTKNGRGCLAFYNSTQGETDEVHFSDVRITALRRGPLEITGVLGHREKALSALDARGSKPEAAPAETEENEAVAEPDASPAPSAASSQRGSQQEATQKPGAGQQEATLKPGAGQQESTLRPGAGQQESRATCSTYAPESVEPRGRQGAWGSAEARAAPTPKRQAPSPSSSLRSSWGARDGQWGGRRSPPTPALLRKSTSDGVLRKSAGAMCGLPANTRMQRTRERWVPLATNAPASEHRLLQDAARKRGPGRNSCADFIPIER